MDQSVIQTATEICTTLFFLSEALAHIPAIRANSVFQLIQSVVKKLAGK